MYYLKIFVLNGCPYSIAARDLLKNVKNTEIIYIDQHEKDKYKTKEISTFPQIYLNKKDSKGSLLLGGYTDLKYVYDLIKESKNIKTLEKKFIKKYNNWSKRAVLRLVKLLSV